MASLGNDYENNSTVSAASECGENLESASSNLEYEEEHGSR